MFKRYFSKLAAAIEHPEQLAIELYSQAVVSKDVQAETVQLNMALSVYSRTAKLLSSVECPVELNPGVFHTFLSVLREDPTLVYLADAMWDEYRKLVYIGCVFVCLHVTEVGCLGGKTASDMQPLYFVHCGNRSCVWWAGLD